MLFALIVTLFIASLSFSMDNIMDKDNNEIIKLLHNYEKNLRFDEHNLVEACFGKTLDHSGNLRKFLDNGKFTEEYDVNKEIESKAKEVLRTGALAKNEILRKKANDAIQKRKIFYPWLIENGWPWICFSGDVEAGFVPQSNEVYVNCRGWDYSWGGNGQVDEYYLFDLMGNRIKNKPGGYEYKARGQYPSNPDDKKITVAEARALYNIDQGGVRSGSRNYLLTIKDKHVWLHDLSDRNKSMTAFFERLDVKQAVFFRLIDLAKKEKWFLKLTNKENEICSGLPEEIKKECNGYIIK